jgi:hypothetical protein
MYDEDVHEVFDTFGVEVPIYFEAIRYRQQIVPEEFFPFTRAQIQKNTDLTPKQQARTRRILTATGWLETRRGFNRKGGTVTLFRITNFARSLIKDTPRRRNLAALKGPLVRRLSTA